MRIHQKVWIFDRLRDVNDKQGILHPIKNCYYCNVELENWYVDLLIKLEEFLPEGFKPLCCGCAFVNAAGIKKCPLCGGVIRSGWTGVHPKYPIIYCSNCYNWKRLFTRETAAEIVKNYFKNLW